MQRVRHHVIYFVWSLMIKHQEISINAYKVVSNRFLCLLYYFGPVLLANQLNKALLGVSCQKIIL